MTTRVLASSTAALLVGLLADIGSDPVAAQTASAEDRAVSVPTNRRAARAPFGPGERLEYKVKVGIFNAGEGWMEVHALDTVRGNPTYHATMAIRGGLGPARVRDTFQTWFDIRNLQSWRFIQDIDDVGYQSYRHYEMRPDIRRWEREDNDESGPLGSSLPLDDVAFVYFLRTLPLEVGKTYTYHRYFKDEGNPVTVEVVRKDRRKVDAGEFNTIVVRPIIKTDGMFGEGGEAELHFTDDERRLLVYMKTDIPVFPGSLTLHLRSVEEGLPLNPASRERALQRWEGETGRPEGRP